MKVGKAGPTTMVSRAKQVTKSKDVKDGGLEGGRCKESEERSWRDLPQ